MNRTPRTLIALVALLVLAPAMAEAATPTLGVPTPVRRGFFTETDLGIFFTTGGQGANPSNAQAYLQLGVGYDLVSSGQHFLAVGLGVSMGASAGACFGQRDDSDPSEVLCRDPAKPYNEDPEKGPPPDSLLPDNWSATTFEATLMYGYEVVPRLMITARGLGGLALIEPMAFSNTENPVPLIGGGLGLEYATHFEHFFIGLDLAGKYFLGPNVLGVAIAPRVKYTF